MLPLLLIAGVGLYFVLSRDSKGGADKAISQTVERDKFGQLRFRTDVAKMVLRATASRFWQNGPTNVVLAIPNLSGNPPTPDTSACVRLQAIHDPGGVDIYAPSNVVAMIPLAAPIPFMLVDASGAPPPEESGMVRLWAAVNPWPVSCEV